MSNSVFRFRRPAALVVGIALSASTFAAPVTYEFTTGDGHSGSFSYEDTLAPSTPNALSASYGILSFTLDGSSLSDPRLSMTRNSLRDGADIVTVRASDQNVILQLFANPGLLESAALEHLNGRTLEDFRNQLLDRTRLRMGDQYSVLTSLQQVPTIPEPGTSALMGLGLAALVAVRRNIRA